MQPSWKRLKGNSGAREHQSSPLHYSPSRAHVLASQTRLDSHLQGVVYYMLNFCRLCVSGNTCEKKPCLGKEHALARSYQPPITHEPQCKYVNKGGRLDAIDVARMSYHPYPSLQQRVYTKYSPRTDR
jgi:hypothetical protein